MSEAQTSIAEAMAEGDTERVERLQEYYFGANGLLSGIEKELSFAEENLDSIGKELMGEGWTSSLKEFTQGITESGLSDFLGGENGLNSLISNTSASMAEVASSIGDVLNGESMTTALNTLNDSIKDAATLEAESRELMTATTQVLDKLPGLTTEIDNLADQLQTYGEAYTNWLENQATIVDPTTEENTEAIKDLTQATIDLRDSLDGVMDGKLNGVELTDGNVDGQANQGAN
jgi:vacuolar-type H+-ATPase subunit I/STV1